MIQHTPNQTPIKVAGYGRTSTDKQQLSPEAQEKIIREWFRYHSTIGRWDDQGGAEFAGMFVDDGITSKVDLLDRKMGQHLIPLLDPGDMIVVAKYARAFRSAADAERTLDRCNEAGIKFVFIDLDIDTSTANGRLLSAIMAAVSRHERDQRSETTRDALAVLKRKGIPITNRIGYVIAGSKHGKTDTRHYAADHTRQMIGRRAAQLFREGYSRDEIRVLLRPAKLINGNKDFGTTSLTQLAAVACLNFPMLGMQQLSELLCMNVPTIEFIRLPKSQHESCIKKISEHARQQCE